MASPDNMVSCASIDLNSIHCVGIQQGLATRVKDNKKAFEKLKRRKCWQSSYRESAEKKKCMVQSFISFPSCVHLIYSILKSIETLYREGHIQQPEYLNIGILK